MHRNSIIGIFISICLCLLFISPSKSQSNYKIRFNNINTDDGLSNNTVHAILKDKLGFIWMATNDGLCRYESSGQLKVYRKGSPAVEGGMESSNIRALYLDSKDNLWIGTRLGGLTKYHQASNTWKTYRMDINDPSSISNDEILTIKEDSKGRLWIGTEAGLNVYNYETDSFISFQPKNDDPFAIKGKAVLTILEDDKGWIWVGTWAGGFYLLIPPEDGNLANTKFRQFTPNNQQSSANVWILEQDRKGRYWIGTRGAGLFLMEIPPGAKNENVEENWQPHFINFSYDKNDPQSISNDHMQDIFEDRNGNIWIATTSGLNRVIEQKPNKSSIQNKTNLKFYRYKYNIIDQTSITNSDVICIFEDDQEIIWFGTYGGISQYNPYTNQFEVHEFFEDISKTPNSQNLYIENNHIAWIGAGENGLYQYDMEKGQMIDNKIRSKYFDGKYVSSLFSPDDKSLYVGSNEGITILDIETKKIVDHYSIPSWVRKQLNNFFIRSLIKDKKGRIWIGSEQGLFVIFEKDREFVSIINDPLNAESITDNTVNQLFEDSNGDIWICTYNGLNKLKDQTNKEFKFQQFKHDVENPESSVPSNRIVVLEEINGVLYIGSDIGLSAYDLKEKTFTNFSKEKDKYSIQSIEKSIDGNLWASTTEGIIFFNTETKVFNKYKKQDGLGDIIFQMGSSTRDKNDRFYFGSRRGITSFDPKNIKTNTKSPPVYVTDIRKMNLKGESLLNGIHLNELELEHNDYYLSLDYAGLNYNRSEKNKYAFILEGFEKNWNYPDSKSPAIYTNLEHGTYTFRVKAANNDGVWNEEGAVLKIVKKPAFWELWWFKAFIAFLIGVVIFIGIKIYTNNINERNKMLQKYNDDLNEEIQRRKIVEAELQLREHNIKKSNKELKRSNEDLEQFAYIASHDLQEPLRVVGSFISLLKRRYSQHFDKAAFEYIDFAVNGVERMSQQIKNILIFSKVGKQELQIEPINISDIIQLKLHDLSKKIKEKKTTVHVGPMPTIFCEKDQIAMVLYNLISNAVKFNKKPKPVITISCDAISKKEYWQFAVQDNGIGISEEYKEKVFEIFRRLNNKEEFEGTGIGLALCKKIIHRHHGDIWFSSKEGEGTTFYFTISKDLKNIINKEDYIEEELTDNSDSAVHSIPQEISYNN